MNATLELDSRLKNGFVTKEQYEESQKTLTLLQGKLSEAQEGLKVAEENTGQLEERILEFSSAIEEREEAYNKK